MTSVGADDTTEKAEVEFQSAAFGVVSVTFFLLRRITLSPWEFFFSACVYCVYVTSGNQGKGKELEKNGSLDVVSCWSKRQ